MQQVYIKMKTEPGCFCLFPGDLSIYSLKWIRCCRSITAPGSVSETLYHALIAMLHHWNMIVTRDAAVDPPGESNIASMSLVWTSLDSYHQALRSFEGTHTYNNDKFCVYLKQYVHHKSSFCEAVKVNKSETNESHYNPKTKETKYKDTTAHTLSLVRVPFEDFGVAVNIHGKAKNTDNTRPISPLILLNDGLVFEKGIIKVKEYNSLKKDCLKSLESLHVFGYREYYKNLLCILVEFYSCVYGKATPVPKLMMEIFDLFYPALINHMMRQGKFKKQEFPHLYKLVMNR